MSKNIVIITEKPGISRHISPVAVELNPSSNITFVHTLAIGLYDFKYPRNLKMHDFPIILKPQWKPRNLEGNACKPHQMIKGELVAMNLTIQQVFANADKIIFALPPDRTGIHAFQVLLSQCCSEVVLNQRIQAVVFHTLSAKDIKSAFERNDSTEDAWFINGYKEAEAKKHFDYNFNVNSAVIFGEVLTTVGVDRSKFILSKYGLVILYYLRSVKQILDDELLSRMCNKWVGTGKYQGGNVGSVISRWEIIHQMIDVGLVKYDGRYLKLAEKGELFLSKLHPDCCDLDLPFRLDLWFNEGLTSIPKIDKYIRTLFGKQKRLFNKI